jgi:hypothetical protein
MSLIRTFEELSFDAINSIAKSVRTMIYTERPDNAKSNVRMQKAIAERLDSAPLEAGSPMPLGVYI